MTVEQKQKLLVDYMVEVVRHYDLPEEQFTNVLPHIIQRVFSRLTEDERAEWNTWFGNNVPRHVYDKCIAYISDMGFDVELGLVSNETILQRLRKAGLV